MPSRGRKRASRQAQLSQKRRRNRSGANARTFDPGPTQSREAAPPTPVVSSASAATAAVAAVAAVAAAPAPAAPRRQRRQAAPNTPMVYRYLGRELRQIGILASVMAAALVALSFVLG